MAGPGLTSPARTNVEIDNDRLDGSLCLGSPTRTPCITPPLLWVAHPFQEVGSPVTDSSPPLRPPDRCAAGLDFTRAQSRESTATWCTQADMQARSPLWRGCALFRVSDVKESACGGVPLRVHDKDGSFFERSVQLRGSASGTGVLESSPRSSSQATDSTSVLTIPNLRGTSSVRTAPSLHGGCARLGGFDRAADQPRC